MWEHCFTVWFRVVFKTNNQIFGGRTQKALIATSKEAKLKLWVQSFLFNPWVRESKAFLLSFACDSNEFLHAKLSKLFNPLSLGFLSFHFHLLGLKRGKNAEINNIPNKYLQDVRKNSWLNQQKRQQTWWNQIQLKTAGKIRWNRRRVWNFHPRLNSKSFSAFCFQIEGSKWQFKLIKQPNFD